MASKYLQSTCSGSKQIKHAEGSRPEICLYLIISTIGLVEIFWMPPLVLKDSSQLAKSVQKQRSIWLFSSDEVGLSCCTVVALWPDKGAEMGQFGRPPYLVRLHTCRAISAARTPLSHLVQVDCCSNGVEQQTNHI